MNKLGEMLRKQNDVLVVLTLVGILLVLFMPIPPVILDILIITNVSFALLLLLLTFYAVRPVDFSTFPSLLLIATLFRLALNVAATRLILSEGDAGKVIGAVGEFVVGGNYVIGIIIFCILVVVQYVVVTNGAQRVAEVAARFTLDSMPGQQMSIDADLNMGFIDQAEAQRRRQLLEKEANFYGSMDGASKFVKGDAIAGIVIILINIIGGLAIGITQLGLSWSEAIQTYTLLTIGDGIVTQVPALIIAVGTGIIVTRSGTDGQLGTEVIKQLGAQPKTLLMVSLALFLIALLPGIPTLPALVLALLMGGAAWFSYRIASRKATEQEEEKTPEESASSHRVEPIELVIGRGLNDVLDMEGQKLIDRIAHFRTAYLDESGVNLPKLRIRDEAKITLNQYRILISGVGVAEGELEPAMRLAIKPGSERTNIKGKETKDPAYGLPALWIEKEDAVSAQAAGFTVADPQTVLLTHLTETLKRQSSSLLTRAETEKLITNVRALSPSLVEELIPTLLTASDIQRILQNLLSEKVSIRNLEAIFEVLVDKARYEKDVDALTEHVRQKLGGAICQPLLARDGSLGVITLDPLLEQSFMQGLRKLEDRQALIIDPALAEEFIRKLAQNADAMMKNELMPALLCAPELRRHVRRLLERLLPHVAVLSLTEVPPVLRLKSFATVSAGGKI
ncbi:MAG: flagellar biosynthesis protein FlhA [Burkholderiales bacterium]|nr:flagellar biosynthesis protein FlhA [Burkholderiales bacterium]